MNRKILELNPESGRIKLEVRVEGSGGAFHLYVPQEQMVDVILGYYEIGRTVHAEKLDLTEKVLARLKGLQPSWVMEIEEPLVLKVTLPSRETSPLFLMNLFRQVKAVPEDATAIIDTFTKGIASAQDVVTSGSMQMVMPVIKSSANPDDAVLRHELNEELVVEFVQDFEHVMSFIKNDDFSKFPISKKELRQAAINNLALRFPKVGFNEVEDGVLQAMGDSNYDASLVLVPELLSKRQHPWANGDLVIAIPARDQLYCCDSKDANAVKKLRELAKWRFRDSAYPISDKLFIMNRGELRLFHQR